MARTLTIQRIATTRINPAPYNPRKDLQPGDAEYERLKLSMEEFGYVDPLVWNKRTGHLVGGHQRFKILQAQGLKHVEVSVVDLTPEREKALNLALNKTGGDWDNQKLAELLQELTAIPDFNIEVTGFALPEAGELIAGLLETDKEEEFDVDAALDREHPPVTKSGEVIELGRHRMLCGDSSKSESFKKLLGEDQAHLLLGDPPYNVQYYGGDRPIPEKARPKQSRQWKRIYGDDRSQEDYVTWFGKVVNAAGPYMAPGASFYIWNGHRQFGPMHSLLESQGFKVSCVITWAKETFAIGYGDYNQQTEFCLYGWREDNGAHAWYGPTNESTLWQVRRDPTKSYLHPTQKPLELAERAIRNSTKPGQNVLECFLGSGTSLIASERTGRRCFGLELDRHFCDVIIRRYIAFVGEQNIDPKLVTRFRPPTPPTIIPQVKARLVVGRTKTKARAAS